MNANQLKEAAIAWHGPLGKWIQAEMLKDAVGARDTGSRLIPESMKDEYEREHLLAKANTLSDFCESIPTRLKDELKKQEQLESTQNKS